ncbi:amidohydrolase [Aquisalibacillus elongatus]|uniref:Amidohydrolase 3 domain-containing protein n=1 Tax=Aquisalibacillus elongatus TaxID=485577 RepID=A0A3N5BA91_9BACI|nr:amidohydrolase [Aquisalibacillus elongatus]RPF53879.1 hypothetical protein EDC24_1062 [Aquisalibacillus elongatus]
MTQTLYYNGKIFTSNDDQLYADALIEEDEKIKWIGSEKDLTVKPERQVDLHEKRVLPGLIDSHMHPMFLAEAIQSVLCLPPLVYSIEDMKYKLAERVESSELGEWVEAWGYDESKLKERRIPTKADLDEVSRDVPIVATRTCTHILSVNSKALELAGITRHTEDPEGGLIERDENGDPTGVLRETARDLILNVKPQPTLEDKVEQLLGLNDYLLSRGLLNVTDLYANIKPDDYELYQVAVERGFTPRVGLYYRFDQMKENDKFEISDEFLDRSKQVHVGGVKIMADGSISGQTAWVYEHYLGTEGECGLSTVSSSMIKKAARTARQNQIQLVVHAMGDRATDAVLDAVDEESNWLDEGPSIRLEHVTFPSTRVLERSRKWSIGFVPQTIFLFAEIESYLNNVGRSRTERSYPIKTFLDQNILTALSSDAPATTWADPANPFIGIQSAVRRIAYNGEAYGSAEEIDVETAIKLYTREAQKVTRIPDIGQLKEGYEADFIVLDQDILNIDQDQIGETKVEQAFKKGELVYQKGGL